MKHYIKYYAIALFRAFIIFGTFMFLDFIFYDDPFRKIDFNLGASSIAFLLFGYYESKINKPLINP